LDADAVRRQGEEVAAVRAAVAPLVLLHGIECDILPDGRLDLADDVLAELDWVQASVHGGQRMPAREMTARVCEALENPWVSCLSHPTGRLLTRRPESAVDLDRVFEVAVHNGVALEVNGLAPRLDLSGEHVRDALAAGARVVCSTDAHSVAGLAAMGLAVDTARRGWAAAADVLNTRPLDELLAAVRGRPGR
jgi:DNA polymerase (family 10)